MKFPLFVPFVLAAGLAAQQAPAPTAPPTTGPSPGPTTPGRPGGTQQRPQTQEQQPRNPFPEQQRPIFLSGKVAMEDGTVPPDSVSIERMCNGVARPEGYTDSKGRFSFQLGQNSSVFADASVGGGSDSFGGQSAAMGAMGVNRGVTERELMGCEIRASLPGFRSDVVNLAGRRMMDNPDVGTIILHRLAKVDGFTFSGTTAFAPKDAKKAYDKGKDAVKKKKWADAETELTKAVTLYPKYAVAWFELGLVQQQQKKVDEARKSYDQAILADGKYVSPYSQLVRLAVAEGQWPLVAENTGRLLKLNPYLSPEGYYYSAVANLNLKNLDIAEEHAREALKMDDRHRIPKINYVLGIILAQRQNFNEAAQQMRDYLKFAPNASDADHVRGQLAEVERLVTGNEPAQAPVQ